MSLVDAHVHLWDLDRFPLLWFREDLALPRAATTDGLTDAAAAACRSLDAAVAVQAADTLAEMSWLRDLATRDAVVRSAVLQYAAGAGWAGLADAVLDDGIAGIRVATPGGAPDLSDVPALDALCEGAADTGRVVEFLARPAQLAAVARLAAQHPRTRIVLCHLGLGVGVPDMAWQESLGLVARRPNAFAKFSGVATRPGDDARLASLATVAFAAFGASRVMFGSDWPMSGRYLSYTQLVDDIDRAWGPRPEEFWGATASELYRV